jgi:hypothetical protein
MDLSDLKKMRKVFPGAVFVFYCIPIFKYLFADLNFDDSLKFPIEGYGSVLAFIIGTLFSNLKIRSLRNKATHLEINENIKSKLLEIGLVTKQDPVKIYKVKQSKELMNIFYSIIDNDESLKEKGKLVRDNGLYWTSTADLAIISCFFCWIYLIFILVFGTSLILVASGLLIGIIGFVSGEFLHPLAVKNHILLGNDQLDYIKTIHKKELQQKISELFP